MNTVRLCFVIQFLCLAACSTLPPAELAVTTEATHSYVLRGQGSPTVILEAGLGDGKESWAAVYPQISEFAEVYAYDRAGYGRSRSRGRTRDAATIVRELRATLRDLGIEPPHVLVGHSIGGTYMELFARTYPEDVAGVVFVDSRHAGFTRRCLDAGIGSCEPPALLSALLPPGPKAELAAGEMTMAEVALAGPFPPVPLFVLTGGKPFLTSAAFYELWLASQEDLAALSVGSTHAVCGHCGHYVHKDAPDLVVDAVKSVWEQALAARRP